MRVPQLVHDVPLPPTPLLGRDQEVAEILRRLQHDDIRLLTLTGPGGSGKTRLALAVASSAASVLDRWACIVDLSPVGDPDLVVRTIARSLGLRESGGGPVEHALAQVLRNERLLLVLDNFEHLLPAAVPVARLLERCPGLVVLATSREPLHLRSEIELPIAPLGLPDPTRAHSVEIVGASPACALFVSRAQAGRPEFALTEDNAPAIADICATLDGLPLAIELAAGWTRVLDPTALHARLQGRLNLLGTLAVDVPARHRTLWEAINWSYGLLTSPEQVLFRTLGVFVGGCTLAAVEAVTEDANALDVLFSLVDKSLVQVLRDADPAGGRRFRMLETVRAFALEQLAASDDLETVRQAHARYFLRLVQEGQPDRGGPRSGVDLDRLEVEHDNMRAAEHWAVDSQQPDLQLRLAAGLWEFRWMRGHLTEDTQVVEAALASNVGAQNLQHAIASHGAAILLSIQGHHDAALDQFASSGEEFKALGDQRGLGRALTDEGVANVMWGRLERARTMFDRAISVGVESGDVFVQAYAHYGLGQGVLSETDFPEAVGLFELAIAKARQIEHPRLVAHALANLAFALSYVGDGARATTCAEECLGLMAEFGDMWGLMWALISLGTAAGLQGLYTRAACLLGSAEALRVRTGSVWMPAMQAQQERGLEYARKPLRTAAFDAAWAAGREFSLDEIIKFALGPEANPGADHSGRAQTGKTHAGLLTRREREVAELIGRGLTSRQIAAELVISVGTADAHADHIRDKLGLHSRAEIASWAVRLG